MPTLEQMRAAFALEKLVLISLSARNLVDHSIPCSDHTHVVLRSPTLTFHPYPRALSPRTSPRHHERALHAHVELIEVLKYCPC